MSEPVEMVEDILNKKSLDQWEIFFQKSSSFRVQTKQGQTDFLQKAELSGIAVRLIKNQRMGFSFSSSLDFASLEQTVDMAESIAAVTSADADYSFPEPDGPITTISSLFCPDIESTSETDKILIAKTVEQTAFAHDKRVSAIRSSGYADSIIEAQIINSTGMNVTGKAGISRIWIELMAQSGTEQEMAYWSAQARDPKKLDPVKLGQTAADRAIRSLSGKAIPSTKCPAIIENSVAVRLLETLSNSFVAESHFKKTVSPRVCIGSEVFSTAVSIFDSGLEVNGSKAFPFDGEGVPSQMTTVVDNGKMQSYLADNYYAKKLETRRTANSCRLGFDSAPFNGVTNLFINPGNASLPDMANDVGTGILITEVMGLHTANPISGDFSVGAAGFKISGGRIDYPVRGIAIAGNIIDLFRSVKTVGSDFEFFGSVGAPSLLVDNLSISGE